jgi:hypothetical protein
MELHPFRARRARRDAAMDAFRSALRILDEDITVFGEQLTNLHVEALTTQLDEPMLADYQQALDSYEKTKSMRRLAETTEAVVEVDKQLTGGRFHLACVLARRDGIDLPTRRESCFFNPQHGPAVTDVAWTPQGGVERKIPVCSIDESRLSAGEPPEVRLVRVGDRWVPWHAAGGSVVGIAQHHAHVMRNGDTRLTDKHVAEAHTRAGMSNVNNWTNP